MSEKLKERLERAEGLAIELSGNDEKVSAFWHGYCQGIAFAIDLVEPGFLKNYQEEC